MYNYKQSTKHLAIIEGILHIPTMQNSWGDSETSGMKVVNT